MATDFDPYQEWLGIEPHERPVNHYRLLGIAPFTTDADMIRQAADERMSQIRQYQMGKRGAQTQPILNALSAAKLCLLNPNTKATYDAVLQASLGMQQPEHNLRSASTSGVEAPPPEPPPAPETPPAEPPRAEPPVAGPPIQEPPLPQSPIITATPQLAASKPSASQSYRPRRASHLPLIMLSVGVLLVVIIGATIYQLTRPTEPRVAPVEPASPQVVTEQTEPEPATTPPEEPAADQPVKTQQEGSGNLVFTPSTAELLGSLALENTPEGDVISGWGEKDDRILWHFHLTQPGHFEARIVYSADPNSTGGSFRLVTRGSGNINRQRLIEVDDNQPKTDAFTVILRKGGDHVLELIPVGISPEREFRVHGVELVLTSRGQ